MTIRHGSCWLLVVLFTPAMLDACTMCNPNFQQRQTFLQDARLVKYVLVGTLANPRLVGEEGRTDFVIEHVIRGEATAKQVITLPHYVPFDPKKPPRYLLCCDIRNGKIDIVRGTPIQGLGVVEYLQGALRFDEKDRTKILLYQFRYLDSTDVDVSMDAFLEFAKATDSEISQVATKLEPEKLRKLLKDPATPADRLGLFAYLLGACGTKNDAALLLGMLAKRDARTSGAMSGLLGGLIELKPDEGWNIVLKTVQDPKQPYPEKLAAIGTVRFYQISKPDDRKNILRTYEAVIADGELADMAIEDLRRWQWWDLTSEILAQYGKKSHSSPLVKRCIVRYALSSPSSEATAFIRSRRVSEAKLVQAVEESLEFEKPVVKPVKNKP